MSLMADELLARTAQFYGMPEAVARANGLDARLSERIAAAAKFRIMPQVIDMATDHVDRQQPTPHVECPTGPIWYEGVYAPQQETRDGGVTRLTSALFLDGGEGVLLMRAFTAKLGQGPIEIIPAIWKNGNVTLVPFPDYHHDEFIWDLAQSTAQVIQVVMAMLASPRVVDRKPISIDPPLQRARIKHGKPPLSDHTEVVVHVTRQEQDARDAAADHERRTGRRLHFVRSFVRTRRAKLERVREHWRGDAGIGVKARPERYRVTL
jgi:hypothetical protein